MAKRSRADVKHAIDLLWAHQIRRENASLYKQVQKVQQIQDSLIQENNAQQDSLRIAQDAQRSSDKALAAIEPISSDLVALQLRCEQTESTAKSTFERFEDLTQRLDVCERSWHNATGNANGRIDRNEAALQQLHDKCDEHVAKIQVKYDEISSKLESKLGQDSLEGLHLKVNVLERQLAELEQCPDSLSRVEESIELPDNQENGIQASSDHDSSRNPQCEGEIADGEEQMLTWHNVGRRESTADESFDLDGNIAVPSYAVHAYEAPPSLIDSLRPIPEDNISIQSKVAQITGLKQGRYHSWDRYLAEGQSIMDNIPQGQERLLVKSFVDGLYAAGERLQCRQWLNLTGWSWHNVAAFLQSGTPSAHAWISEPRIDGQQVTLESPLARSKPVPTRERRRVVNHTESSNLNLPHQKEPETTQAPRRSRRIAESQSRTQGFEAILDQNHQQQGGAKPDKRDSHTQNRSKSNSTPALERRILPARKTLAVSSFQETPSESRFFQESLPGPQDAGPDARLAALTPPRQSLRPVLPAKPRRDASSVATGPSALHQTRPLKRAGLYDWARTDSDMNGAAMSDGVQLPKMPSPKPERRKKRKIKSASERRAMLPPPDIPILPTSE